ncbi:Ig-like domain-containing protein [Arthrobacter sp. M2012083]|uniref:Ig-like domain-containing protein n=1 Tax=Arthrobacter sp. M2012083 TaxID=1197706 RepID=UPI0002EF84B3|nr:Ig-like domain-containing protein [Arthrobacter sp. M2012083]
MSRLRQTTGRATSSPATLGRWNRIVVIVLGIFLVSWGGPAASAFWGSVSSGFGAAKADAVAQGARPTTAVSGTSVTVNWTASTTAAGRPVTGYSIARYATATEGTGMAAAGTCTGTIAALSCVDNNVPTGTWYYAVTPLLSAWQGAESTRSVATAVDATPPVAPVITAPAYVYSSNVNNVPVSGTAESGSTVVLTVTGAGAQPLTQTMTANGSGNWTAPPLNMSAFNEGNINYSARATDAAGNTGPAGTAASTKDVTAPTVTGVQLTNGGATAGKVEAGDHVTLTFSEPLKASTICSTWTSPDNTQTVSGNGNNRVVVNVSANDILSVTTNSCPVLRVGSVALGGDYTSSNLSFNTPNSGGILHWSSTSQTLTVTLGGGNAGGAILTSDSIFPTYTPASGLTDVAGNQLGTSPVPGAPSRF